MFAELHKIQQLIRATTGAHYTLAGGCVRDTSVGVKPKDYDAVLCCGPGMCEADAFATLSHHVRTFRVMWGARVEEYMAYGQGDVRDGFKERLYACGKVTMPDGVEIDLLLDKAMDMDAAISQYDCNMNSVYLTEEGPSQPFPTTLEFTAGRITGAVRDAYMQQKFKDLTNKES